MICKFVGLCSDLWNELANLNHTRIIVFSSVLIDREVRKVAKLNSDELRDQDTSRETSMATQFTPFLSLAGGALIGLAAVLLMAFNGRIAGISGIVGSLLPPYADTAWSIRLAFVVGLVVAPVFVTAVTAAPVLQSVSNNLVVMGTAGLLVGFGSVYGSGCTSGHGVCGLSRLSARSLVATATFMAAAFVTVLLSRHVVGG